MSWFGIGKDKGRGRGSDNRDSFGGFGDIDQIDGQPSFDPRIGAESVRQRTQRGDDNCSTSSSDDSISENPLDDISMGDESTVDSGLPLFDESAYSESEDELTDSGLDSNGDSWRQKKASSFLAEFYSKMVEEADANDDVSSSSFEQNEVPVVPPEDADSTSDGSESHSDTYIAQQPLHFKLEVDENASSAPIEHGSSHKQTENSRPSASSFVARIVEPSSDNSSATSHSNNVMRNLSTVTGSDVDESCSEEGEMSFAFSRTMSTPMGCTSEKAEVGRESHNTDEDLGRLEQFTESRTSTIFDGNVAKIYGSKTSATNIGEAEDSSSEESCCSQFSGGKEHVPQHEGKNSDINRVYVRHEHDSESHVGCNEESMSEESTEVSPHNSNFDEMEDTRSESDETADSGSKTEDRDWQGSQVDSYKDPRSIDAGIEDSSYSGDAQIDTARNADDHSRSSSSSQSSLVLSRQDLAKVVDASIGDSSYSSSTQIDAARKMLENVFDDSSLASTRKNDSQGRRLTLADELEGSCFDTAPLASNSRHADDHCQSSSSNQSSFTLSPEGAARIQKSRQQLTDEFADRQASSTGSGLLLDVSKSDISVDPVPSKSDVEDDSESESDDDSYSSSSDSSNGEQDYSSKLVIREAPLLRLENCTSMTRTAIAETKQKKMRDAKNWGWFGLRSKKPEHNGNSVGADDRSQKEGEDNATVSSGNDRSQQSRSQETVTSRKSTGTILGDVKDTNQDDPTTQFFKSQKGDASSMHVEKSPWKEDDSVTSSRISASKSVSSSKSTSSATVGSLKLSGSNSNESSLSPAAENLASSIDHESEKRKVVHENGKKKKKERRKSKKEREKSLKAHFGKTRRVSRHGDEVSVGTMDTKKKSVQHQHVVLSLAKSGFDEDDESTTHRPWRKGGNQRSTSSRATKLGVSDTIKEEDELDLSENNDIAGILGAEALEGPEAEGLEGTNDDKDDDNDDQNDGSISNSELVSADQEGDDYVIGGMASFSALENIILGDEETKNVDFDDMWDEVSVDLSTAMDFDRKKQEKERKDFKRAIRKQRRSENKVDTQGKRLELFDNTKKSSVRRDKSKFSTEFIDAIHKVFEDDESSEGSMSYQEETMVDLGASELDLSQGEASQDENGTIESSSKSSIHEDESSSVRLEDNLLRSGASLSGTSYQGSLGGRKGVPRSKSSTSKSSLRGGSLAGRKSVARSKSSNSRSSLRSFRSKSSRRLKTQTANPAEIFEAELKRQKENKSLSVSNLRQEMLDRRGSSVELLRREYEQQKFNQGSRKKSISVSDDGEVETGELGAPPRSIRSGRTSLETHVQASRWELGGSVSDLDDLRTVTQSPQRPPKMLSAMTGIAQNLAVGTIDLASDTVKQVDAVAQGGIETVRRAGSSAVGFGSNTTKTIRQTTASISQSIGLGKELTMKDVGNMSFRASFDDMPLTTIGEVEDYEDENERGLLGGAADGAWDEGSLGGKSHSSRRSGMFSLKGKLPKVEMKLPGTLKKMKSMIPRREKSSGPNGFALGDDEHGLLG